MAEAVFMHKVRAMGLSGSIAADSAGTGDWHVGQGPHEGTRKILADKGIEYNHSARILRASDYDDFDLIVTMDDDNSIEVTRGGVGKAKVKRFLEFAPASGLSEVPDPYYSGNFTQTFDLADQAADGLLAYIRREHAL
jgi:protein-tyrosine phosphatase